jgi:hypothetical protein
LADTVRDRDHLGRSWIHGNAFRRWIIVFTVHLMLDDWPDSQLESARLYTVRLSNRNLGLSLIHGFLPMKFRVFDCHIFRQWFVSGQIGKLENVIFFFPTNMFSSKTARDAPMPRRDLSLSVQMKNISWSLSRIASRRFSAFTVLSLISEFFAATTLEHFFSSSS